MPDMSDLRKNMVQHQIAARGVSDERVLDAMRVVPREAFMPDELGEFAYEDTPLPIEEGQTISQPYIVALMIAAIEPRSDARVLEIGTGSGYAAAVLSRVVDQVYTVERHEPLVDRARRRFRTLGYDNVEVLHGDGSLGWPEHAPYDAIIVTAGGPHVPQQLRDQLAVGGRMVIPIGSDPRLQQLVRVTRVTRDRFEEEQLGGVRFVPLVGADAWGSPGAFRWSPRRAGAPDPRRPGRSFARRASRSPTSTPRTSAPSSIGSVPRRSSRSARRATAPPTSTRCAPTSRGS
jgi:protein-L-isoaspartate(D-aspartate) O-methyltransferase